MKTRVAAIVTLLTLALLGVLLVEGCAVLAGEKNGDIRDNLDMACWAMGATLAGDSREGRVAVLSDWSFDDRGVVAGIYKADGSVE